MNDKARIDDVLELWEQLGERERSMSVLFLKRVLAGQHKYGKLSPHKVDWTWMSLEETLDNAFYLMAKVMDHADDMERRTYAPDLGD